MEKKPTIIITSIGKRVQLIQHLKKSFKVIGVDSSDVNPNKYFVDKFYKIPRASDKGYIDELLKICKSEKVDILIPLYEGEFEILDANRKKFQSVNTKLMLSSKNIIEICKDKNKTFKYFTSKNIKNPKVYSDKEIENIIINKDISKLPLFIKPSDGMGSSNVYKLNNITDLVFFKNYIENPIIQEYVEGTEYTVDVLVDFNGAPIYIVPRVRLEVRSGEVVKTRTDKDNNIINTTIKVIDCLNELRDIQGNATMGPLTIQFFKTNEGKIYLLEINPRFGGGVPLSFECGADYGNAILKMIKNENIRLKNDFLIKTMLRFDDAVYTD